MVLREKYLKVLSQLLPAGALSALLTLGAGTPAVTSAEPHQAQPATNQARISDRLAAVRDAVSDIAGPRAEKAEGQLAWWAWRNGGGGWRNGGGFWRNLGGGGWRNGGAGWGNGGWRNGPWNNFWRNW
jgi:rSAM-associated Gly-rich repeat protein